jgi:NAD-dependent histone deacetylase SIR2
MVPEGQVVETKLAEGWGNRHVFTQVVPGAEKENGEKEKEGGDKEGEAEEKEEEPKKEEKKGGEKKNKT